MKQLLDATALAERRHFWFLGFRRFIRPLLVKAVAGYPRAHILDCGCGTGANLAVLNEFGDALGIDREWTGVCRARASGRRVSQATVTALPFGDEYFDLATSFDVLYCLETSDERGAVAEMFRVLRPGGRVIINVAAMPFLVGNHSVLAREVRRYTAKGLRALLERAGFTIERLTYTNAGLLPILLPLRLLHRLRGLAPESKAEQEIRMPSRPVNALLDRMLALEAVVVQHLDLPWGSSLLVMARKPTD
jgi:SAM-dependent methyltransferase